MSMLITPQAVRETDSDVVLSARNVSVVYDGDRPTRAVRDVSLDLRRGEILGIAGESGCGKSTLAYALTRMLRTPARLEGGSVHFTGCDGETVDLTALDDVALRAFRWQRISMVFQSAMSSLNPVTSLARQFDDIFRTHLPELPKEERRQRAAELLAMVGIDPGRIGSFPHELSGGMRQRVGIAMALALDPEVVIMDEPTTALDVVVQREILDEVTRLQEERGFSVVFITHDLSLLMEISDRIAVMYGGELAELGPADAISTTPAHPYSLGLLRSFPDVRAARRELRGIPGSPPDLRKPVVGCAFAPRCEYAFGACGLTSPRLLTIRRTGPGTGQEAEQGHVARCLLHDPQARPSGPPPELSGTGAAAGTDLSDLSDQSPEESR
jgi:peptide/nickel transport system ATP-binding protein